jgi:hypothetical protein
LNIAEVGSTLAGQLRQSRKLGPEHVRHDAWQASQVTIAALVAGSKRRPVR